MATNNITTTTATINIYNNTDKTINPNKEPLYNNLPNIYIPTKVCNACRIIKQLIEFYKCKTTHDGYRSQCKNCCDNYNKQYRHKYYENNTIKIIEHQNKYYNQNKDKINETHKKYNEKIKKK